MAQKNRWRSERTLRQLGALPNFVWLGLFFALGAITMVCLHLAFPSLGYDEPTSKPSPPDLVSKGPWGELEYTTINLERPDDSFPQVMPEPRPIRWIFENCPKAQLEEFFAKANLTAHQRELLLDPQRCKTSSSGCEILPPLDVVRDMSLSARSNIYAVLRLNTNNTYMQNPCHFEEGKFEEWLSDSGLSPEKQKIMHDLSLHEKGYVNFYDGQLLEWMTPDPEERKHIAKAMTRYPTIVMKLHITPKSDLDALERYWAQGTRGQRMRPFLESLGKVPQGISMSVSFFFPTFARMRLYSYPDMGNPELAHRKNCFYTAMNFFNEAPDYTFLNGDVVVTKLQSDYMPVTNNYIFGDLMVFGNDKELIHMCVYIADDVVFTKNGANFLAPWVLMKRTEMLKEFADFQPMKMAVYRKKHL